MCMKNVTRLSSSLSTGWSQMNDLETKRPDIKCPNLVPTINDGWDRALASWITKERRRDIKHIPNQEILCQEINVGRLGLETTISSGLVKGVIIGWVRLWIVCCLDKLGYIGKWVMVRIGLHQMSMVQLVSTYPKLLYDV